MIELRTMHFSQLQCHSDIYQQTLTQMTQYWQLKLRSNSDNPRTVDSDGPGAREHQLKM